MTYPTQEDELRDKEAQAKNLEVAEETRFISAFHSIPKRNARTLGQMADAILGSFNVIMNDSRRQPYDRQEDLMVGLKKLFEEEIRVIESRRYYVTKINPSTTKFSDAKP